MVGEQRGSEQSTITVRSKSMFVFETMRIHREFSLRHAISTPNREVRPVAWRLVLAVAIPFLLAPAVRAQIAPIQPPSQWKVPNGTAACSVEKSCAELAPAMVQSALGPSPLEENLRYLTTAAATPTNPLQDAKAAGWALAALRKSGVDEVHIEKFKVPASARDSQARTKNFENVIAEIRGSEKPNEYVLLGAQLDSAGREGPLDDRSSAAVVLDAARVIHASGNVPRRSIRFVLFAGGQEAKAGSLAYVRAHRMELDRMIAAVIFEGAAGRINGYSLAGREDALATVREALAPLGPLGVKNFTMGATIDSNRFGFILEGVPTLAPNRDSSNQASTERTAPGKFDKAEVEELKHQVAIAAITAYALADDLERIAPRQSRAQVEQLVKETGLEQPMKTEGSWPAWESGQWP
jgi:Peptidase family M28